MKLRMAAPAPPWSRWLLPLAFLALCGPLGVQLALITPPGRVADEPTHASKAESLVDGSWLGHREVIPTIDGQRLQQGVDGDPALLSLSVATPPGDVTAERLEAIASVPWGRPIFLALGTISGYWPGFYLAAAAALRSAKAVGATPLDAFLTARIANLAVYLAMGMATLALARRGRALLFCTLAIPMALSLGASINQDGLAIASSALAVALLTRRPAEHPSFLRREAGRIAAAALFAAVVLAKPPYLPLAGLLLLPFPAPGDRRSWGARAALVALVAACGLGWTWVTVHYVATPVLLGAAEAGPLWPGPRPAVFFGSDMPGQMLVLLQKPVRFLTLPWQSILHDDFMLQEAIGVLAYLNLFLPAWLYAAWKGALVSSVAADLIGPEEDAQALPIWQAPVPLLCAFAALFAIYLSQYLSWTPVGERHIVGPQGRYWLPLLPVVAFALPRLPTLPRAAAVLTVVPLLVGLADVFVLPGLIVRFFYVH